MGRMWGVGVKGLKLVRGESFLLHTGSEIYTDVFRDGIQQPDSGRRIIPRCWRCFCRCLEIVLSIRSTYFIYFYPLKLVKVQPVKCILL